MGEITVILLLALIFLGPKKLPELASGLGKIIKDIRKATSDVKNEIKLDETIRKPFEELRDAVTLPPEELKRRDRLAKDLEEARRKAEADIKALAAQTEAEAAAAGTATGENGARVTAEVASVGTAPAATDNPTAPTALPEPGAATAATSGQPAVVSAGATNAPLFPPPGTIPATPGKDRATVRGLAGPARPGRVPAPAPAPVAPPVPPPVSSTADRTGTTQFLSEADLMPPSAAPPPIPRGSGKYRAVDGPTPPPPPPPAAPDGKKS